MGISLSNIIVWLVLGIVAGIIVNALDKEDVKGGLFGAVILGVIGAMIGGFLSVSFTKAPYTTVSWQGFITAVVGGFFLAILSRLFFKNTGRIKTQPTDIR